MKIMFVGVNHDASNWQFQDYSLAFAARLQSYIICETLSQRPDVVICIDYHSRFKSILREAKEAGIPRVLVKQEPSVVLPDHRKPNPSNLFTLVITRGSPSENPQFNTYQEWEFGEIENHFRSKRTVAISGNKWSMVPGEYYSLRRQAYSEIENLDLFGTGWNTSRNEWIGVLVKESVVAISHLVWPSFRNFRWAFKKPRSYLGKSASKVETLSSYHASLVIENSQGYMSEKLVDCILAGTIPVYVGESVHKYDIPENLVIQAKPTVESIRKSIGQALSWDGTHYRTRAKTWAQTPGVRARWDKFSVSKKLFEHIQESVLDI